MNTYIVLYCMPYSGLEAWKQKPEAERQAAEKEMQGLWATWMQAHSASILETAGAGSTTRVTPSGATDAHNDVMMYSRVQAENKEAVSQMFVGHPHLQIPGSWIDIMQANAVKM
jgi:hypothetical protein